MSGIQLCTCGHLAWYGLHRLTETVPNAGRDGADRRGPAQLVRPDVERWLQPAHLRSRRLAGSRTLLAAKGATTRSASSCPALDEEDDGRPDRRRDPPRRWSPRRHAGSSTSSSSWTPAAPTRTAARAAAAGRDRRPPRRRPARASRSLPGKGEVLWRSLAATTGDVLVFVDADLRTFSSSYVTGLLGPLLTDRSVALVKGVYDRPLRDGDACCAAGGGRVTELVARPLLNLHWPELAGVVQPLAGEYAARRALLEQLPFPTGYGVELALLVDTLGSWPAWTRSPRSTSACGSTGTRTTRGSAGWPARSCRWRCPARRGRAGCTAPADLDPTLTQFERVDGGPAAWYVPTTSSCVERPPMVDGARATPRPRVAPAS